MVVLLQVRILSWINYSQIIVRIYSFCQLRKVEFKDSYQWSFHFYGVNVFHRSLLHSIKIHIWIMRHNFETPVLPWLCQHVKVKGWVICYLTCEASGLFRIVESSPALTKWPHILLLFSDSFHLCWSPVKWNHSITLF